MTTTQIIGAAMMVTPLLLLFGLFVREEGFFKALIIWTCIFGIVVWVVFAATLISAT